MYNNNSSNIHIPLWIFFSGFIIMIFLSLCEYFGLYMHNTLIRTICLVFGIAISALFLEYILQYKIFKNSEYPISKILYNSIFVGLILYLVIYTTNLSTWIFIVPSIIIVISFMRYNDFTYLKEKRKININK